MSSYPPLLPLPSPSSSRTSTSSGRTLPRTGHAQVVHAPRMQRLERLFREYGWVVLFALFCYGLYYRVHMQTVQNLHILQQMHAHLLDERQKAYQTKAELTLDWQSGGDIRSRERILMRELGLVPKGFKKIVFTSPSPLPLSSSP